MFWGLTPALDLLQQYETEFVVFPNSLNILLVGGIDSRHVLKTIARRYRHPKVEINFYLVETCVENVAKQLLLLYIALQQFENVGLEQRTKTFIDLYGNTLVKPSVAKFLASAAQEMVKMVTNYDYMADVMPGVSLEGLKYKDRDYLENVLKFWCGQDDFDICASWDRRLRKTLGPRYDSKVGAFDWDLHMRFRAMGGHQVSNQEYRDFRMTGVAFSWLESEVSKPNRSMVSVVIPNGDNFVHCGYLGDMQTGPFVPFGLECEEEKYLTSIHGQYSYRATDITQRNLCQLFYEIHLKKEYTHQPTTDYQLGAAVLQTPEKRVVDVKAVCAGKRSGKCAEVEDVHINFLSLSVLDIMKFRKEYKKLFQLIYFGSSFLKYCSKELVAHVTDDNALLIVENQRFVLSFRDKQLQEYEKEIDKAMDGIDVAKINFNVLKDDFAKFVKK